MFDYIYVDICTFLVSYMIHQHETSWNSYEIYQKACMSFVPLPGQFEMDPLLGCWSRYLGTGAQDVAGRLGGATDQRQRRVFAVLSGVFHRSYDAFQQADPKTSGTWALNMKGGICGDFGFALGRGYHKPVFWWKLMSFWDIFCWELCWLAFCQSWCHHLNLRMYILYVFFEGIWKIPLTKQVVLFTQQKETNITPSCKDFWKAFNRHNDTWHDSTRPIGLVEPGISSLWTNCMAWPVALSVPRHETWGWSLVLGGVSCFWCCRWYIIWNDVVGSWEGLLLKSDFWWFLLASIV